jgi:two-component system, NarL family, invasion response regulator UvrY
MLRILIADDHEIIRRGLKYILLEGFSLVHIEETDNAETLISKACADNWDIVISDISMPGGGGLYALQKIMEQKPLMRVLILSVYPEEQYAVPVIRTGAWGYLNKNTAPEELVSAVRQILGGHRYIPETIVKKLYCDLHEPNEIKLNELLSERELHVFKLLAKGKSIAEISGELSIETSTVSICRSLILAKMNKKNNADLTRYAEENQII